MKLIPLTQGKHAQVDDSDFAELNAFNWYASRDGRTWYALRKERRVVGPRQRTIQMHRQILGLPAGVKTDHQDQDGLNNQRHNIRPASDSQSNANRRKPKRPASSQYKGVYWASRGRGAWVAYVGKRPSVYLGRHHDEEDAARAYDKAAKELFGEFAKLNFP